MNRAFVADASVALAWVHAGQATAETDRLLDAIAEGVQMEVPALWPLEVANALLVLVRRRKLTDDERRDALQALQTLPIRIDHEAAAMALTSLSVLASAHRLSVYDASYLELAERRKLPLACKDGPLRKAASERGVLVLG